MPKTVLLWTSKASDERPSTRCEVPTDCAGGHLRHLSRSAWRRLPRFGEVQRMSGLGTKRCCMRTAEGSAFWGKADALISASDRREVAGLCASLPTLPPRTAAKMAENRGLSWDGGQIRRETDCLLEEAVTSEPVSGIPIPWLLGKIQGNSLELRCSPLGTRDRSRAYTLNSLVTKQGIFQGIADNWRAISGQFFDASG